MQLNVQGQVRVQVQVNVNVFSLGLSNATEEQQVVLSHMGHAYATRCVYKYRVQLIAPTALGNV